MLRAVLFFFAVSSGSIVNSLTVKGGSKPPSAKADPNNPIVEKGWRVDGYCGIGRTPTKAERVLDVEVAPNNDLYYANDFKKYYGACPEVRGRVRVGLAAGLRMKGYGLGSEGRIGLGSGLG